MLWDILREFLGHNFVSGLHTLKPKNLSKKGFFQPWCYVISGCVIIVMCGLSSGLRKYHGRLSYLPLDDDPSRTRPHSSVCDELRRASSLETDLRRSTSVTNDPALPDSLQTPARIPQTLPALSSAVPPDWVTIEDDFVLVLAIYHTHLAQDMLVAPDARLSDGVIHLSMVRAPISRVRLVKLFNAMQDGTASDDPSVEMVRVSAFRLEPLGRQQGAMNVDGEAVNNGPIQAQVLPSMARVMSLPRY